MNTNLEFIPKEIIFNNVANNENSLYSQLVIKNNSDKKLIFKIRLRNVNNYAIKPSYGEIEPVSSITIKIVFLKERLSRELIIKHTNEFLILYTLVDINNNIQDINGYIKTNKKSVKNILIKSKVKSNENDINNVIKEDDEDEEEESVKIKESKDDNNVNFSNNHNNDNRSIFDEEKMKKMYVEKMNKLTEENHKLKLEISSFKDKIEYNSNNSKFVGYKLWQLLLCALIFLFLGGFLK